MKALLAIGLILLGQIAFFAGLVWLGATIVKGVFGS